MVTAVTDGAIPDPTTGDEAVNPGLASYFGDGVHPTLDAVDVIADELLASLGGLVAYGRSSSR
jgi:lysophospholipase L1-like esterase